MMTYGKSGGNDTFEAEYRIVKPGGDTWIQGRERFAATAAGHVVRIDGISRESPSDASTNESSRSSARPRSAERIIGIVRVGSRTSCFATCAASPWGRTVPHGG